MRTWWGAVGAACLVNDKRTDPDTGERMRFSSAILPPWAPKTPQVSEVLPLLYLHGLSSGDFVPALGQFLSSSAGLSSFVVTKLTETWKAESAAFSSSSGRDTHPTPAPVGVARPEHSFSRAWLTIPAERQAAPNGAGAG